MTGQHPTATGRHRGRLALALGITLTILAVEVAGAAVTGSLALFADAGHMGTDAAGVGLSLIAAHFATRPATTQRTFGYARAEILAATVNALLLFAVGAFILVEGVRRLDQPARGEARADDRVRISSRSSGAARRPCCSAAARRRA